jgi:hypothetical protein
MSGEAITLPDQVYADLDNNLGVYGGGGLASSEFTYNFAAWSNYRLPAVHRLDIGANFRKYGRRKHYMRTWSLGVFNVYGRPNVMFVDLIRDEEKGYKLTGISILQFIPYVTYKMNF